MTKNYNDQVRIDEESTFVTSEFKLALVTDSSIVAIHVEVI